MRKVISAALLGAVGLVWFFAALGADVSFGLLTTEDQTQGESPICEVHQIKMTTKHVPIWYGLYADPPAEYFEAKDSFPHAWGHVLGGCMIDMSRFHKRHALVFSCPRCEANRAEWIKTSAARNTP